MATIEEWVSRYKPETRYTYQAGLFKFLDFINKGEIRAGYVTKAEKQRYEEIAATYLSSGAKYGKDIELFTASIQDKPPKSVRVYISAVKEWLAYNDVDLTDREKREIKKRIPKGSARTIEADLDHDRIRRMLAHCTSSWMRAIILMLSSSGMRIGELLKLRVGDIDQTGTCWMISIRAEYTKGNTQRFTFISSEAVEAVKEWLKERDTYLKGKKSDLLFPMTDENVRIAFRNVLKKMGEYKQDSGTNRSNTVLHGFRKFFSSQLRLKVPADIVEMLMGHNGYLSDAYRRYNKKQIREYYEKGQATLSIMSSLDIQELREKDLEKTNAISSLAQENLMLKQELVKIHTELKQVKEDRAKLDSHASFEDFIKNALPALIQKEMAKKRSG